MTKERGFAYHAKADLELRPDVVGASFWAVATARAMLSYFELEPHAAFPQHRHESEQITMVLSGRLLFEVAGEEIVVGPGEVIALESNVAHAVRSLEEAVVAVDAWSPPRRLGTGS